MKALLVVLLSCATLSAARNLTIPDGFLFGAATAAYQVEGAWNTSGKGESIWDNMLNSYGLNQSGEVAADSYHFYKEDVKAAKEIGLNFYRFSISWPRILPDGDLSNINQDGIDYYNNLINELKKNNIEPVVTIYHWDLPVNLQYLGGFVNNVIIDYFEDYAWLLFTKFGDRVKWWITFNEPYEFVQGYGTGMFPPAVRAPGVGDYLAAHNVLKAHAKVYHMYDQHFRSTQKGKVGITLNYNYGEPKTNSKADLDATERLWQFSLGWFAHPIFSKAGDYPAIMKERVANRSKAEGLARSRLPEFNKYWLNYVRGAYDFFGLNYYTSYIISASNQTNADTQDMEPVVSEQDASWPVGCTSTNRYAPFGLRKLLKQISDNYNNVPILITENGWCDGGEMNDTMRIKYIVNHYAAVMDAINEDKVTVLGHSTWSLIDTFEWFTYSWKYGLYHVNYTDPNKTRTPRASPKVISSVIKTRKLPAEYLDKE